MRLKTQIRSGVTAVECAIIFPCFFLILIGMIIMGLGVFRYQEVAHLAREGARWASVRGHQYQQKTGNWAATPEDVYENAIKPKVVGLDISQITYSVTWDPSDKRQGSMVSVTVNYDWVPEAFFGGMRLSSTSTVPVSF